MKINNKTIVALGFFILIGFSIWISNSLIPLWALLLTEMVTNFISEETEDKKDGES